MPSSSPSSRRAFKHTRAIQIEAFARDDGLWDVDAHTTDIETHDTKLASGIGGCIHLTELATMLPTATIQTFAGEVLDTRDGASADQQHHKPYLDRCHALRTNGETVAKFYPCWAVKALAESEPS